MEETEPDLPQGRRPGSKEGARPAEPRTSTVRPEDLEHLQETGGSEGQDLKERQRIGPYRLVHRLGEGGMGVVWLAEQLKPVRREVALKVIKRGMDTRRVIARFEAERQALAMMDHPNIAKVLDAGETPRGRPYFVMEYVRGVPITIYCENHKLSVRERLALFREVCEGVQHAHQKAVIHRDLKPSNILVTQHQGRAVPKIIDFGVAKATAQRLTEHTLYTELGQMIGTPAFMSPEQAGITGEDVDTRTDVYSLGAVLYNLLTGALPFDPTELRKEGVEAVRRHIRDQEPPRPSTRVKTLSESGDRSRVRQPSLAAHQLSGDLDWIVMKAMDKDRNRRYASPQELATDVTFFLEDAPVKARPPSTLYRIGKFARRHRTGVAVSMAVLVLLVVFAVAMAFQARRLAEERDRKEAALAESQAVTGFLTDMLVAVDPKHSGADVTVREVLDAAAEELDTAFQDQPALEAEVRMAIGRSYNALGLPESAEETARIAHALRRSRLGPDHPETLNALAVLANAARQQGHYEKAERQYRQLLEARRRVLPAGHLKTGWARNALAVVLMNQGHYEEAEGLLTAALEPAPAAGAGGGAGGGEAGAETEETPVARQNLTQALTSNLAVVYHVQGRLAEAERLYRQALAIQKRALGPRDASTLKTRGNLGEVLADQGNAALAEELLVAVLRDKRTVYGDDHPSTLYTMELLAGLYAGQGRLDEARPLLEEAWQDRVRTLGPDHPQTIRAREELEGLGGGAAR